MTESDGTQDHKGFVTLLVSNMMANYVKDAQYFAGNKDKYVDAVEAVVACVLDAIPEGSFDDDRATASVAEVHNAVQTHLSQHIKHNAPTTPASAKKKRRVDA